MMDNYSWGGGPWCKFLSRSFLFFGAMSSVSIYSKAELMLSATNYMLLSMINTRSVGKVLFWMQTDAKKETIEQENLVWWAVLLMIFPLLCFSERDQLGC